MAALPHVQPNRFQLRVMLNRVCAQLAPEAGALVSTKRQCGIHQTIGVDPDRASAKLPRDGVGFFDVSGPDSGGKSVRISIRQFDDLIDVIEAKRRQHRTEDFFLRNLHVVFDFAEDRGLNEKAFAAVYRNTVSARDQLRAFLLAGFDVAENSLHLLLAHDRAHAASPRCRLRPCRKKFRLSRL